MHKVKLITDSPSDIPDEALARYDIGMCCVPITVDGKSYFERRDFTPQQFYAMLEHTAEIPATSRIPAVDCMERFHRAFADGCTDVIMVTINSGGSGIFDSARMAGEQFFQEHPEARARMRIHLVDSGSYAIAYGHAVVQAAKQARHGNSAAEILAYLTDYFDRIEIYLACFSLKYAAKSGRITAASAFVGEALGLRPIIAMIDGKTRVIAKVRGDRQVIPKLFEIYRAKKAGPQTPVLVASGAADEQGEQLCALIRRDCGRKIPHHKLGAAIVVNAGPKSVGLILQGERRGRPRSPLTL